MITRSMSIGCWPLALAFAASVGTMPATAQSAHDDVSIGQQAPLAPLPLASWSEGDVTKELARCAQLLRGLDVVARRLPPLKEHDCGTPAPLELISIGKSPQVSFSPPVTVTCDLAAALNLWIKKDLQSLARKHLGAEIIRIDTMSSYSCRTAYGRKNTRLSEHGRANALDIRAFITARGSQSEVLADWGPTGREIAAQVAAAKKNEAAQTLARSATTKGNATASRQPTAPSAIATGSIPPNVAPHVVEVAKSPLALVPRSGGGTIDLGLPSNVDTGLGLHSTTAPRHLGGPALTPMDENSPGKTDFLRAAHDSACRIFGTVLGPEANSAHRNHFHVDMAERKIKSICE